MDELAVMEGGKCILQLRGVRPFFSSKYDLTQHPRYKYLLDYDEKNRFDVAAYLSTQLRLKPGDQYLSYEFDYTELEDEDKN